MQKINLFKIYAKPLNYSYFAFTPPPTLISLISPAVKIDLKNLDLKEWTLFYKTIIVHFMSRPDFSADRACTVYNTARKNGTVHKICYPLLLHLTTAHIIDLDCYEASFEES